MIGSGDVIEIVAVMMTPNLWPTIPVRVGDVRFSMVVDTGSFLSSLGPQTYTKLSALGYLQRRERGGTIRGLHINDIDLGDVSIRDIVSGRDRIGPCEDRGLGGILGLSFLQRFEEVCFSARTMRVTFRRA